MTILLILGALCLAWQRDTFVFRTNGKGSLSKCSPFALQKGYF